MKKLVVVAIAMIVMSIQAVAGPVITIIFNTKSHWDGNQCATADKGVCLHVSAQLSVQGTDQFSGTITYNASEGIVFKFSKSKDLTKVALSKYFVNNSFVIDSDSPISPEILKKIGFPTEFTLKQGKYSFITDGDIITVVIPAS